MTIRTSNGLDISLGRVGTGIRYAACARPESRLARYLAKARPGAEAAAAIVAAMTPEQRASMRARLSPVDDAKARAELRAAAAQRAAAAERDRRMVAMRAATARQAAIDAQALKQRETAALWENAIAANNPKPAATTPTGNARRVANLRARSSSLIRN